MAALTTIATTAAALATGYAAVKGVEYAQQQASAARKAQRQQEKALSEQKEAALEKRKQLIRKKRAQIMGAGDYEIGRTGGLGIMAGGYGAEETLTGAQPLG